MSIPIARLIYEINQDAGFPPYIYGYSMMLFHAFNEFVASERSQSATKSEEELDALVVGITCLILAVKFNEDHLNSVCLATGRNDGSIHNRSLVSRSVQIVESAARAILSYQQSSPTTGYSFEEFVGLKNKIKDMVCEYTVLRIVGNFATSAPVTRICIDHEMFFRYYATPQCLNQPHPHSL